MILTFVLGRIKVMSTIVPHSQLNISQTVRDRGLGNGYWVSNGQLVMWPMTSRTGKRIQRTGCGYAPLSSLQTFNYYTDIN